MNIKKLPEEISSVLRSAVLIPSPAQAVVELVLNSIDAGATSIIVLVDLRIFKLQVDDNGQGVELADLETIGERYVTSKCYSLAELYSYGKYHGYRGEALASLCEVSGMLEIVSRPTRNRETYEKLFIRGKAQAAKVASTSLKTNGTSVTITDFMYNMSVRRKSMHETVELEAIKSHVEYISLVHPQVSFIVKNEAKRKLILHKHKSSNELSAFGSLFGQELLESLGAVHFTSDKFKIRGYISKKPHRHRGIQLVYVNRRAFLSSVIHDYVKVLLAKSSIIRNNGPWKNKPIPDHVPPERWLSFPSLEKRNRFSVFVIFIECAHAEYDISWDSKKSEIYFKDRDGILKCLGDAIKQFLERENLVHIDPDGRKESEKIPLPCLPDKPSEIENSKGNEDVIDYATWDIQGAVHGIAMKRPNRAKQAAIAEMTTEKEEERDSKCNERKSVPETAHVTLRSPSCPVTAVPPIVKFVDKTSSSVNRLKITKGAYLIKMNEENRLHHISTKLLKYKCPQKDRLTKSTINTKNPQQRTEKKRWKDIEKKISSKPENYTEEDSSKPIDQNIEDMSNVHSANTIILPDKTKFDSIPHVSYLLLDNLNYTSAVTPPCSSLRATFNTTNSCYKSADETPFISESIPSVVEEDYQPSDFQINSFNMQKHLPTEDVAEVVEINELIQHDDNSKQQGQNENEESCTEKLSEKHRKKHTYVTDKYIKGSFEKSETVSFNVEANFLTSSDFVSSIVNDQVEKRVCEQAPDDEQLKSEAYTLALQNNIPTSLSPQILVPKSTCRISTPIIHVDISQQHTNRCPMRRSSEKGHAAQYSGEISKVYCHLPRKEKHSKQLQTSETLVISIPNPQEENLGKESRIFGDIDDNLSETVELNGKSTDLPVVRHTNENFNSLCCEKQSVEDEESDKRSINEVYFSPYFSSDMSSRSHRKQRIANSPSQSSECQVMDTEITLKQNNNFLSDFKKNISADNATGKTFSIFSFERLFESGEEHETRKEEENSPLRYSENSQKSDACRLRAFQSEDILTKEGTSLLDTNIPAKGISQSSKCNSSISLSSVSPLLENTVLSSPSYQSGTRLEPSSETGALSNSQEIVTKMNNLTFESPYFVKSSTYNCKKKKHATSENERECGTLKRRKVPSYSQEKQCQESFLVRNVPSSVYIEEQDIFVCPNEKQSVHNEQQSEKGLGDVSKDVEIFAASELIQNQTLSNNNTDAAGPVDSSNDVDETECTNTNGKAKTRALENTGWVKLHKADGRPFYMHTNSGATSYCTPHTNEDEGTFAMTKRPEIIPKGMSPILAAPAHSRSKPKFSPASRKMLQDTYLKEKNDDNLENVKWKHKPEIEKSGITDVLDVVKTSLQTKARYTAQLPDMMSFVSAKMTGKLLRYKYNKEIFSNLEVIAQFDNKFIIVLLTLDKGENPSIIGIFDQHAVHERIRLENLMKEYSEDENEWSFKSSKLLEPLVLDITPRENHIMSDFQEKFEKLGLRFSFGNENSVEITDVPTCLIARAGREQVYGNNEWLKNNVRMLLQDQVHFLLRTGGHEPVIPDVIKDVINSEACKGAVKFGDPLSLDECKDLLSCLSQCDLPFQCAHGRPSFMPVFDIQLFSDEVNKYLQMNN